MFDRRFFSDRHRSWARLYGNQQLQVAALLGDSGLGLSFWRGANPIRGRSFSFFSAFFSFFLACFRFFLDLSTASVDGLRTSVLSCRLSDGYRWNRPGSLQLDFSAILILTSFFYLFLFLFLFDFKGNPNSIKCSDSVTSFSFLIISSSSDSYFMWPFDYLVIKVNIDVDEIMFIFNICSQKSVLLFVIDCSDLPSRLSRRDGCGSFSFPKTPTP